LDRTEPKRPDVVGLSDCDHSPLSREGKLFNASVSQNGGSLHLGISLTSLSQTSLITDVKGGSLWLSRKVDAKESMESWIGNPQPSQVVMSSKALEVTSAKIGVEQEF